MSSVEASAGVALTIGENCAVVSPHPCVRQMNPAHRRGGWRRHKRREMWSDRRQIAVRMRVSSSMFQGEEKSGLAVQRAGRTRAKR